MEYRKTDEYKKREGLCQIGQTEKFSLKKFWELERSNFMKILGKTFQASGTASINIYIGLSIVAIHNVWSPYSCEFFCFSSSFSSFIFSYLGNLTFKDKFQSTITNSTSHLPLQWQNLLHSHGDGHFLWPFMNLSQVNMCLLMRKRDQIF